MTISLIGLLVLLLVGAIVGAIAEMIVGYSVGGFFAAAVLGFVGALIGNWLAPRLGLPSVFVVTVEGHQIDLLWAILGAALLLLLLSLFRRGPYRRRRYI